MVIIFVVVGCGLSYFAITYTQSDSLAQDLPRGTDVFDAYMSFSRQFGSGAVYPTMLILVAEQNRSVISEEFFVQAQDLVLSIVESTKGKISDWSGAIIPGSSFVNPTFWFNFFTRCFGDPVIEDSAPCRSVKYATTQLVNATNSSTILVFSGSDDPLAPPGKIWLAKARAAIDSFMKNQNQTVIKVALLQGTAVDSW